MGRKREREKNIYTDKRNKYKGKWRNKKQTKLYKAIEKKKKENQIEKMKEDTELRVNNTELLMNLSGEFESRRSTKEYKGRTNNNNPTVLLKTCIAI